ncbi:MAG: hypothetical protein EOO01_19305 [Chitinophagaceae bacterium]|nr:MAG: hypothetical protein EOO01_19305 [Chitinophagaceae bacterium]
MKKDKHQQQPPQAAASLSLTDYLNAPVRIAQWDIVMGEVGSVQDAYKAWGEEVPHATKQRMARRIVDFRQEWQGYVPDVPLSEAKTLTEKECQEQLWSFNDLQRHHNIIEAYHGHPDNVPEFSRTAMDREKQEFLSEIAEYQAVKKEQSRAEFKMQLETMRKVQQHQKHRPK